MKSHVRDLRILGGDTLCYVWVDCRYSCLSLDSSALRFMNLQSISWVEVYYPFGCEHRDDQ